ncbi:hypothetical protein AB0I77_08835 [Streptomyces sp. NPDC050619]|uniref:hypothetical protein n=1 Tax=Streptomyces sp. NPDC050619 TaxID=3157214 RepID=UPI003439ED83
MDSDEHVCPVCGQPVDTIIRRHKTLGAWVPEWVPGPCRNPECEAYGEEGAEGAEPKSEARKVGPQTAGTRSAAPPTVESPRSAEKES